MESVNVWLTYYHMSTVVNFNKKQNDPITSFNQNNSAAITPSAAPVQVSQQSNPASSGQFTNVQKYLNANKQAGQQVAQNVSQQVEKNLAPSKQEATDTASRIAQQVEKANTAINEGNAISSQLNQPTQAAIGTAKPTQQTTAATATTVAPVTPVFNAQEFIKNEDNLKKLIQHQSGTAINSQQLKDDSNTNKTVSDLLKSQAVTQDELTKTNLGRTGLIQQTFNKPGYTSGQNRLDNTFLSGNKQGLQNIQAKTKQEIGSADIMVQEADKAVNTIQGEKGLLKQASDLGTTLRGQTKTLSDDYIKQLNDQIALVNQQRAEEQAKGKTFAEQLVGKTQSDQSLDQSLWDELKLKEGESTFNVFDNLTPEQIFNFSKQQAEKTQDVATQADVDYYKALAMMQMGQLDDKGKLVAPREDQLALSKASELEKALSAITGTNSVRTRLDDAQKKFIADAINNQIVGTGFDKGSEGWFGSRGADANARIETNLASHLGLSSDQLKQILHQSDPNSENIKNALGTVSSFDPTGISQAVLLADQALSRGQLLSGISNSLASATGASSGSMASANQQAQNSVIDQIISQLQNSGANNILSKTGKKNVSLSDLGSAGKDLRSATLTPAIEEKFNNSKTLYNMSKKLEQGEYDNPGNDIQLTNKRIIEDLKATMPNLARIYEDLGQNANLSQLLKEEVRTLDKGWEKDLIERRNNARTRIANTMSNISNVAGGNSTLLDKLILPFTQEKQPTGLPKGTPIKLGSK